MPKDVDRALEDLANERSFLEALDAEYKKAVGKHGRMNSLHEGYAVLAEEVDEFWDEVKKKPRNRKPEDIRGELIQIAAVAMRNYVELT